MEREDLPKPPPLPRMPSGYQVMASSRQASQDGGAAENPLREVADLLRQLVELMGARAAAPESDTGDGGPPAVGDTPQRDGDRESSVPKVTPGHEDREPEGLRFTAHPDAAVDQTTIASYSKAERQALEVTPPGQELRLPEPPRQQAETLAETVARSRQVVESVFSGGEGAEGGERRETPPPVIGSEPKPQASADPLVEAIERLVNKLEALDLGTPTSPRDPADDVLKALDRIYDAIANGGGAGLG